MRKYAIEMTLIAECDDDPRSPVIRSLEIHRIDTDNLPIPVANTLLNGIYDISEAGRRLSREESGIDFVKRLKDIDL